MVAMFVISALYLTVRYQLLGVIVGVRYLDIAPLDTPKQLILHRLTSASGLRIKALFQAKHNYNRVIVCMRIWSSLAILNSI